MRATVSHLYRRPTPARRPWLHLPPPESRAPPSAATPASIPLLVPKRTSCPRARRSAWRQAGLRAGGPNFGWNRPRLRRDRASGQPRQNKSTTATCGVEGEVRLRLRQGGIGPLVLKEEARRTPLPGGTSRAASVAGTHRPRTRSAGHLEFTHKGRGLIGEGSGAGEDCREMATTAGERRRWAGEALPPPRAGSCEGWQGLGTQEAPGGAWCIRREKGKRIESSAGVGRWNQQSRIPRNVEPFTSTLAPTPFYLMYWVCNIEHECHIRIPKPDEHFES